MTTTKTSEQHPILQRGTSGSQRVRYYNGMLLDEKHLEAEQHHQDSTRQELARLMLGCGIIDGLAVDLSDSKVLRISRGRAVDGAGRILRVEEEIVISAKRVCGGRAGGTSCCDGDAFEGGPIRPDVDYCIVLEYEERRCDTPRREPSKTCRPAPETGRVLDGWRLALIEGKECPTHSCCAGKTGGDLETLCNELKAMCTNEEKWVRDGECHGIALARIKITCPDKEDAKIEPVPGEQVRRHAWTAKRLDLLFATLCAYACQRS